MDIEMETIEKMKTMEETEPEKRGDYVVYLLFNTKNNCTYVGCTNNPVRRLRQHNGDLVGGARYTKFKRGDGEWKYYGQIMNLDKHNALSIEKKIQRRTKKAEGKTYLDKRLNCICKLFEEYDDIEFTQFVGV
jgi:putative endonuclease